MKHSVALCLALFMAVPAAADAQGRRSSRKDRVDRVTNVRGTVVEGKIQKETWQEVVIQVGSSRTTLRAEDVDKVEYWDAPPAFRGAVASIEQEKWSEANSALTSAEEYANSKERGIIKPRDWFPPYVSYYRGLCQMHLGQANSALKHFEKVRTQHKDFRLIKMVYERTLQVYREKKDVKAMTAFEEKIKDAPRRLQKQLRDRATGQRAELLYDQNKYAEAKRLFESIANNTDREVAILGTSGVIRCLTGLKDSNGINAYCEKVRRIAREPALLLIATNAMANVRFKAKKFVEARDLYIESVVLHNPGRRTGTGAERDHERAIWRLGECYEGLIKTARNDTLKKAYMRMASSTFRELAQEYPSSRRREDALAKAVKYEVKEPRK